MIAYKIEVTLMDGSRVYNVAVSDYNPTYPEFEEENKVIFDQFASEDEADRFTSYLHDNNMAVITETRHERS